MLAWIFTEENFITNNPRFLSFGKLRASYGTTGSDQIGDYTYLNLYNPTTSNGPSQPYQGTTGLEPQGLTNPYLEWKRQGNYSSEWI